MHLIKENTKLIDQWFKMKWTPLDKFTRKESKFTRKWTKSSILSIFSGVFNAMLIMDKLLRQKED